MKYFFQFLCTLLSLQLSLAQSTEGRWVGEVMYRDAWAYARLDCDSEGCTFNLPYVDGQTKFRVFGNPMDTKSWSTTRRVEKWKFETKFADRNLTGKLTVNGKTQPVLLMQQLPLDSTEKNRCVGFYKDINGFVTKVYERFSYLHVHSPYSEQIMSLKPVRDNRYWTVAGEYFSFENLVENSYKKLIWKDKNGQHMEATRFEAFTVEEVWIPVGEDTIYGLLHVPFGAEPKPGVLVLPGGGNVGLDNYKLEAEFFASHGMVALLCDKAGVGKSKGPSHFQAQNFAEKLTEYTHLFQWLRHHKATNPDKVGVHGNSEGGRLALMLASTLKEKVAFANAGAVPVMTFKEIQLYAMDMYHRNLGVSEERNLMIRNIWNQYYEQLVIGNIDTMTIQAANEIRGENERYFLPPAVTDLPLSPRGEDVYENTSDYIADIQCPVLIQFGENDQRVDGNASVRNYYRNCKNPANTRVIFYPRGNHSFMTPEQEICTGYLDDKWNWLRNIVEL